mmetsp:Transcript_72196/g.156743  ORF Transcript_72196/g.156743 Transcript_72196/m.156743 type:complete len:626 (+) Transcript_72196:30-1907(+)
MTGENRPRSIHVRVPSIRLTVESLQGPPTLRASFVDSAEKKGYLESAEVLGRGSFGVISLVKDEATGELRAMKSAKRKDSWTEERLQMEAKILQNLDHPHILRIFSWHQDGDVVHMFTEVSRGGELMKVVRHARCHSQTVPEAWAVTCFRQTLEALVYIHSKGIVHKDLKGENLLLLRSTDGPNGQAFFRPPHVVICDLGLAEVCHREKHGLRAVCVAGTPSTMAPEVWNREVGPPCDIWSVGCMVYELFSGRLPFCGRIDAKGRRPESLLKQGPDWTRFMASEQAKLLCQKLLTFQVAQRPTAAQALKDVWFEQAMVSITKEEGHHLCHAMQQWHKRNPSQRALSLLLAVNCTSLKPIAALFSSFDADHSGTLDPAEIVAALMATGVDRETAKETAEALDVNNDGFCEYLEFSAAALPSQEKVFNLLLQQEFARRDLRKRGVLSPAELAALLGALRPVAQKHGLTLQTLDANNDGEVSFGEFCEYFGASCACDGTSTSNLMQFLDIDAPTYAQTPLTGNYVEPSSYLRQRPAWKGSVAAKQPAIQHPLAPGPEAAIEHQAPPLATASRKKDHSIRLISGFDPDEGCSDWTQSAFLLKQMSVFTWGSRKKEKKDRDLHKKDIISL